MPTLDILDDDAFSMSSLTATVNKMPFVPGQVGSAGLFEGDGVTTTTILIEQQNGSLSIVEDSPRGAPGETVASDRRDLKAVRVPHFQRDDAVYADEVQNVRAFGSETEVEAVSTRVDSKIARHVRDLDTTTELLRVGAIKGVVAGKNGTIQDLYSLFGVAAPAVINWDFTTLKPRQASFDVKLLLEDELDATNYEGAHAYCGSDFFKSLVDHKEVRETYMGYQAAADLRGEMADVFTFGGITWERYRTGKKAKAANSGVDFIAVDEARLVLKGVPGLFIERFAPADYEETVNTVGIPRYAKQYAMQNGKGRHLEVQMNRIPLCTQPLTLRRIVKTA
jgi:Phage major capsid protein E